MGDGRRGLRWEPRPRREDSLLPREEPNETNFVRMSVRAGNLDRGSDDKSPLTFREMATMS